MLFTADASHYATQVSDSRVTCLELVSAALDNIEQYNALLNAIVYTQRDEALATAQRYDEQRSALANLPPFYGVPILLKDLGQAQAGHPSAGGSQLLRGSLQSRTSHFVERVIAAGFIVVGRTNVPEFGFKNISDSKVFGAVNSPLDLARNPGGSSGGAAAALKAGLVPVVTASDGGGSIRIPASFSGLIGLKPSRGRVPVGPGGYRGWQGASVEFFLTKSSRDTFGLLKAMQAFQPAAPFSVPRIEEETLTAPSKALTIAYTTQSPVKTDVSAAAEQAVLSTVDVLKRAGHQVINDQPTVDGVAAMQSYFVVNAVETAAMMRRIEQGLGRPVNSDEVEPISWALYRSGLKLTAVDYSNTLAQWDTLSAKTDAFFNRYDILLMPTVNGVAPYHGQFELSSAAESQLLAIDQLTTVQQQKLIWQVFADSLAYTPFTQQQNLTGQPAVSLPLFKEASTKLPLGVQFSARKGREYLLLQVAKQLEAMGVIDTEIVSPANRENQ